MQHFHLPWGIFCKIILGMLFLSQAVGAESAKRDKVPCYSVSFEGVDIAVCMADQDDDVRLFHSGTSGIYGNFSAINRELQKKGQALSFSMNAGMYHPNRRPLGLYVEEGKQKTPIVTREGPGNFGLLPNGVFCIADRFYVMESRAFQGAFPRCRYATQSGPMLLIEGVIHPRFLKDSDSTYIRNGVGVSADGTQAFFVMTNTAVNFHRFARFFRDVLKVPNALYFDGSISRLYAPSLNRHDTGLPLGPIVGVVIKEDS